MSSVILSSPFSNSSIPAHPVLVPNSPAAGTRVVPGPRPGGGRLIELPRGVMPGSRLELRPDPARVPSGVREMDALTGGLPRGALTEIFGPASSGRTSLLLAALAEATQRQEVCALVDVGDAFNPESAVFAGADLKRLLWVRTGCPGARKLRSQMQSTCSPTDLHKNWSACLEQALKTTDLLLQSGGFGMVIVDLADVPPQAARRIPLTSWFRFRRAVENTPTVLLVMEQEPYAKTCASLVLKMNAIKMNTFTAQPGSVLAHHPPANFTNHIPAHAQIFRGLPVQAEVVHARTQRKPSRSVTAVFDTRATWTA